MSECYFCKIEDPNELHYDPESHHFCIICAVKLWELAQQGLEFEMRGQTITVAQKDIACEAPGPLEPQGPLRKVALTTGYGVVLEDEDALEHLFNAIVGEVISQVRGSDEFGEQGFHLVYDRCRAELYYVAGQLKQLRSDIDISFLVDEFDVQWDRIAAKISNDGE